MQELAAYSQLLRAAESMGGPRQIWFRGVADSTWALTPGLLRKIFGGLREKGIYQEFRRRAVGISAGLPNHNDLAGWMFLMQHHGLPTRLLDWSESALVALYFATESAKGPLGRAADGAVYILDPCNLNRHQAKVEDFFTVETAEVATIIDAAFNSVVESDRVFAVKSAATNTRIYRQSGHFTIHGNSYDGSLRDIRAIQDETVLREFVIPADAKRQIRIELEYFGINEATIFHDLDSLARDIVRQYAITTEGT